MATMSPKRQWAWVKALAERIEAHNTAVHRAIHDWHPPLIAVTYADTLSSLRWGNDPDDEERPFIIWEDWKQRKLVAQWLPLLEQRNPEYPEFDDRVDGGFSDEYTECSDCGNIIRTSPDSYDWQPDFHVGDGEILCRECIDKDPESVLEDFINETKAVPERIPLAQLGWDMVNEEEPYESGWHLGMTDDPNKVTAPLVAASIDFVITAEPSQFYTRWYVWVREDSIDEAKKLLGFVEEVPEDTEEPDLEQLKEWVHDGVAEATDGCTVEPDGTCPHGKPSWLRKLGYV